jgi:nucleoside-diphosphate-sugar epimerase
MTSIFKTTFVGKNVLVVGGKGFIGAALVAQLQQFGTEVITLGLEEEKTLPANASITVPHITADLRDQNELSEKLKQHHFSYVFNISGFIDHSAFFSGGRSVIDSHYIGTLNLLESINHKELCRYVQIGSSDEYGKAIAPQREDQRESPISSYSAAKTAASHLVESLFGSDGFPGVNARLFLAYGPRQGVERFIPFIIMRCLKDESFPTSEGGQLRDFCFIDDLVNGLLCCAIKKEAIGETFNLASGRAISIREVVTLINSLIGSGKPNFGEHPYRPGENMALYADISKAVSLLGWEPEISLEDGLKRTISWYMNQNEKQF